MRSKWRTPGTAIAIVFVALVAVLVLLVVVRQPGVSQEARVPAREVPTELVLDIPQKAVFKNYVVVSAEARPGTRCELTYVPPSGKTQQMETTADADGVCKWRWKIEESGGKGAGRLIFTVDGKSETHFFEVLSSF